MLQRVLSNVINLTKSGGQKGCHISRKGSCHTCMASMTCTWVDNFLWRIHDFCSAFQGLDREALDRYQVRAVADQDGLVLPVVNLDGKVVGVKTVTMQTVKSDDKEKIRVVTRTIPRCVSHFVAPMISF